MAEKSATLAIRIAPEDRDAIARLASKAGMSQSDFIVARALGRPMKNVGGQISDLERRLEQLEGWTGLRRGMRG
jgi:hypothetical protein